VHGRIDFYRKPHAPVRSQVVHPCQCVFFYPSSAQKATASTLTNNVMPTTILQGNVFRYRYPRT